MTYISLFLLGGVFGSFLNMLAYRLPEKVSLKGRSICPACKHPLSSMDLIPYLSYILLKGRCRYCGDKIGVRYFFIEVVCGVSFVFTYYYFGFKWLMLKYTYLCLVFILVTIIDLRYKIIPNHIVVANIIIGLVLHFFSWNDISVMSSLIGFLVGGSILFLIALIGPMGGGDIKLMASLGLFLGWKKIIIAIILSFIIGGFISLILVILKIKGRKDKIAFGPFLIVGAFLVSFYYFDVIKLYMSLIY